MSGGGERATVPSEAWIDEEDTAFSMRAEPLTKCSRVEGTGNAVDDEEYLC